MWTVENEEVFGGKKLWLRPGKRFLFGRTRQKDEIEAQFIHDDKTISRKHLVVEVAATGPDDAANARSRSHITLTDLGTKIGTLLNGEQIRGSSRVLDHDDNEVMLGKFATTYRFTWIPVTFTFSFTTKQQKADPWTRLFQKLGPIDIKVTREFERGFTTHYLAKKRNTSKGLQALIDGKYIVDSESFLEAVVAAATPREDGTAPLEQDFEANFPDPMTFLPEGAIESQFPDTAFAPNLSRRSMFEGYTFIFYNQSQFSNLLAPISEGSGKALLREVIPNQTTVEEFIRYVKVTAGDKGLGEFEDGSGGKGVVVVRFNSAKPEDAEWYADFCTQVALLLDHRLVEQNQFLDAVLGNDASVLRKPLQFVASGIVAPPGTAATTTSQKLHGSESAPNPASIRAEAGSQPARRSRGRRVGLPKFKGFDDDDDDTPMGLSSISESMIFDPPALEGSESQRLLVSQNTDANLSEEVSQQPHASQSRKRKLTPTVEEDIVESVAPAAARLKKRRLEEESARRRRGEVMTSPKIKPPKPSNPTPPPPKKKTKKQLELEVAAQFGKDNTEGAAAMEESPPPDYEELNYGQMQALTITEIIEPKRRPRPEMAEDDRWNGRKNFKKFRRQGDAPINPRDLHKTIVPLEAVKTKAKGVGDEYWGAKVRIGKSQKGQQKSQPKLESQEPQKIGRVVDVESEDELPDVPNIERRNRGPSDTIVLSDDDEETSRPAAMISRSQTLVNKSISMGIVTTKRSAAEPLTKAAPAKKARQTRLGLGKKEDESEDSEDELRFRFKKRGRS